MSFLTSRDLNCYAERRPFEAELMCLPVLLNLVYRLPAIRATQ